MLIYQILRTLNYLKNKNIVHRDMKMENIMLESFHQENQSANFIRLIDFGYSIDLNDQLSESLQNLLRPFLLGTPYYIAPEQLESSFETKIESYMWSLGVIVYYLLTAKFPFDIAKGNRQKLNKKIICCDYAFPEDKGWRNRKECKDFIERLLEPQVQKRMTPQQALEHQWL